MTLAFKEIAANVQTPGAYTEIADAPNPDALLGMPLTPCIVGVTKNKAVAGQLFENISAGDAVKAFGAGSTMAQAVKAFLTERPDLSVDAVAVAMPDGAAPASGNISFTGTVNLNSTGAIWLGGQKISFSVNAGAQPSDIVQAILGSANSLNLSAINGLQLSQDAASAGQLNVTAGEAGESGNAIDIRYSPDLSDQIEGISSAVSPMKGGTGKPDLTEAWLAMGDNWVTDVVMTLTDQDSLQSACNEARRRGAAMVAKDMRVFAVVCATQGEALSLAANFNTHSELVLIPVQNPKFLPWNACAAIGAQVSQSLNNDPARQLRGILINTLSGLGPEKADLFIQAQRNVLLLNGCSTFLVARDGTVTLERIITTRTQAPENGVATGVFDVMIPAVSSRIRFEWDSFVEAQYSDCKLADEGSPLADRDGVVTTKTLKGSWAGQCALYQTQGWIDDVDQMVKQSSFERSKTNRNRVDEKLFIMVMGSLMIVASQLKVEH